MSLSEKENPLTLSEPDTQEFWIYLAKLWRRRLLIISIIVVCVALTVAVDATRHKIYAGTASMQLVSQNVTSTGGVTELQPADVLTDIQLVESSTIQSMVSTKLGSLAPKAAATEVTTTNVVKVSVSSKSPTYAAKVANDYVNAYIEFTTNRYAKQIGQQESILKTQQRTFQNEIQQIETEIANNGPKNSDLTSLNSQLSADSSQLQTVTTSLTDLQLDLVQVPAGAFSLTPAVANYSPTSPKKFLDAFLALIVGLLLAVGVALLLDFLDDRIRSKDQLQSASGGLPLLGEIPFFDDWTDEPENAVIATARPQSAAAEAYRSLRTSIQFIGFDAAHASVIQITSPLENEGKTTTVIDLAVTIAANGAKVVIVGCDLRKPGLQKFFASSGTQGLSSILGEAASIESVLISSENLPNLSYVPSGPIPPNPSELLASKKLVELFESLREQFDVIIVDSPPVLPVTDAIVIAQVVDTIVLITRAEVTTARALARSLELLANVNAPVKGVVLNAVTRQHSSYRYGRNRYGRYYTYGTYGK
jgi:capsular exopolysaccharide synthesis family protein